MKQNYRQAKRQKELARKARQQEKQHKRVRPDGEPETVGDATAAAEPGAESTLDAATPTPAAGGTGAS